MTRNEQLLEIAKVIYPKCIESVEKILWQGGAIDEDKPHTSAAKMAIRYASELLRQHSEFNKLSFDERKNF